MHYRRAFSATALSCALSLIGCNNTTERARPEPSPSSAASAAGTADESGFCEAAPSATAASCGSEWCEEHGVAEADCTVCKARGTH